MSTDPKNILSLTQKITVWDKLKEVLVPAGDGLCTYADNLDDEKVAEMFTDFKVTQVNVASVRKEMFGQLVAGRKAAVSGENERRLQRLERQVERLTALARMSNPNFKGIDDD